MMDNQNQEHQHAFYDYGETYLKCPCGVQSEEKANSSPASSKMKPQAEIKDEALRLNNPDSEAKLQALRGFEANFPSRPVAPTEDQVNNKAAHQKGQEQPTVGTMTGAPKDAIREIKPDDANQAETNDAPKEASKDATGGPKVNA